MPTFRRDLRTIPEYKPGRPIEEVARELGLEEIIKLASNECPHPPFPEVEKVVAEAMMQGHRYPETTSLPVRNALAEHHALSPENFLVGAGSSQLLRCVALAAGGPGTSAVFADPSFVMYTISALISRTEPIPVPVDQEFNHDLDAMRAAIRTDTRIAFLCNPNNPTGNAISATAVAEFVDAVPDNVLIVLDEAYAEYVTAPDWATGIPLALQRDNVIVSRTFSKVYGLAGLRIGYFVGNPETLEAIRRVQAPFSVTSVAQAAAVEALQHQDRVAARSAANATGRNSLSAALAERGVQPIPSQANFIAVVADDALHTERAMTERGIIVRRLGSILRITVGTEAENVACIDAWDSVHG